MITHRSRAISIFSLSMLMWALMGWNIATGNGLIGSTSTWRWHAPFRSTPRFAWDGDAASRLVKVPGGTQISAGQSQTFVVTLPRGYASGFIQAHFSSTPAGAVRLSAEALPGQEISEDVTTGQSVSLLVQWESLVARGHSFRLTIQSITAPVVVSDIIVHAQR